MQEAGNPSLWDRCVEYLLRRRKPRYAPAFYAMYRNRWRGSLSSECGCCVTVLVLAGAACAPLWYGAGSVLLASCAAALLLWVTVTSVLGTLDGFSARVLPYFEREIGGTDTWLAGEALLWNSQALDEIARAKGLTPLSDFASGDPLRAGEQHAMYAPEDALRTAEGLLGAEETARLGKPVLADLTKLRDALARAQAEGVRFSLHLRMGNAASGHEMDQREGSYF